MDDALISIGQFAGLTWLSPKALRLYQSHGLLEPAEIDASSGYRYYSASQIPIARRIGLLRRAGVVHPNGPLTDQPWGLREFAVLDGDGNMIKFGQRMAS